MMQHVLLALYPRSWRDRYGEEYCALLEDTGLSPSIALDAARSALMLQLQEHARLLSTTVVLAQCLFSLWLCVQLHITDNMFWPPTTLLRAAGLGLTYVPLLYLGLTYLKLSKQTE